MCNLYFFTEEELLELCKTLLFDKKDTIILIDTIIYDIPIKQVAEKLHISFSNICHRIRRIKHKLKISNWNDNILI